MLKSKFFKAASVFALLAVSFAFTACNSDDSDSSDAPDAVTGISLSADSLSLIPGEEAQLTVSVEPAGAEVNSITWETENALIASADASGLVYAPGTAGTAVITVTVNGTFTAACTVTVTVPKWTGELDFSWYNEADPQTVYTIYTPAQLEALAWIVSERLGDLADFATATKGNVTSITGTVPSAKNRFANVQFYLANDLDMGACHEGDIWSGPNYYPVGASCASDIANAGETDPNGNVWYGAFCGKFDGQGHVVSNIYCNRLGASYSDSQMCALIGRVGVPDDESGSAPACNIVVENVAVTGYIRGGRSCGGIVGKTLHVAAGNTVEVRGCMNFASVRTENGSKGVGGVVGALWNGGTVNNCANFGSVTGTYKSANAAGISGAAEAGTSNSYNVGTVTNTANAANCGAVALNQSGSAQVTNCWALDGSCPGYVSSIINGGVLVSGGWKTADEMKSASFVEQLNTGNAGAWVSPAENTPVYTFMNELGFAGYPVPKAFTE